VGGETVGCGGWLTGSVALQVPPLVGETTAEALVMVGMAGTVCPSNWTLPEAGARSWGVPVAPWVPSETTGQVIPVGQPHVPDDVARPRQMLAGWLQVVPWQLPAGMVTIGVAACIGMAGLAIICA
jgi:hypothetical protein